MHNYFIDLNVRLTPDFDLAVRSSAIPVAQLTIVFGRRATVKYDIFIKGQDISLQQFKTKVS